MTDQVKYPNSKKKYALQNKRRNLESCESRLMSLDFIYPPEELSHDLKEIWLDGYEAGQQQFLDDIHKQKADLTKEIQSFHYEHDHIDE